MKITGEMLIGSTAVLGHDDPFKAFNPTTGEHLEPTFGSSSTSDIDRACLLASEAFDTYRETDLETRAVFLETIAKGLQDAAPAFLERAVAETGLPAARIQGELGRTTGQLRFFAAIVREGRWLTATIDNAQPDRKPMPRSDLRLRNVALGPVAVFGASNFPLAFSVAGGDTASALAAGCPVVVKAHPAHPGTSEIAGRVIQQAVADCHLPEGVFSLVTGTPNRIGEQLVKHPAIQAVGFTGSRGGGLALLRLAQSRPVPIPLYAEMSSINPMFLLPVALESRAEAIAKAYVDSVVMGTGQFCTNPGLVLGVQGPALERFLDSANGFLAAKEATAMLTSGIHGAYERGVGYLLKAEGVNLVAKGKESTPACAGVPSLFLTTSSQFNKDPKLAEEVFGPSSIVIACQSTEEMVQIAEKLEGQLTATLQMDEGDIADAKRLLPTLERKAGRILANGFPTGVEVCSAMVHGGPYPATSDSHSTSVGGLAIMRFLRPVCYQDLPDALLPIALQKANPLGIDRRQT